MNRLSGPHPEAVVSVQSVSKRYGVTTVLHDVSLDLVPGRCLALAGENGAGKSTLVKIISGVTQPSSGELKVDGARTRLASPRDAKAAGIAIIPQELAYCPDLSVAENLLLGRWPQRFGLTNGRRVRARAREVLKGLGLDLDLDARMTDLGLAKRQLVEIGKALSANARVLILDEPTASLNGVEADRLLATLAAMKARGVALVYISHRLDECFRLADEIVVLRNGYVASRRAPAETTTEQIVADMLGREYSEPELAAARARADGAPAVKVVDWVTEQIPQLHGVSFEAHAGEVLAIFGLVGSGVESIARGLGGHPGMRISGSIEIGGQPQRPFRDPGAARRMHVGYVPAERKTDGLALARPIQEALTVLVTGQVSRAGVVRHRAERRLAKTLVASFKVRCQSPGQPVGELSGGNQQKVLLASRLAAAPQLLVLHEPTRGVDVGARAQIHELVVAAARNGAAVIVVTSDLAEAIAVADRVHVVRQGVIVAELSGADKTEAAALTAATAASDPAGEGRAAS